MPIFGTWIETVANGGGIVTEITPTTIISRPRTAGGVYGKIITTGPTGYRALGNNPRLGQAYAIEPYGPDNKPQPGITAYLHDPDNLLLDFAGMGMHHLTRLVPGS